MTNAVDPEPRRENSLGSKMGFWKRKPTTEMGRKKGKKEG
jgi:hypothetical protein